MVQLFFPFLILPCLAKQDVSWEVVGKGRKAAPCALSAELSEGLPKPSRHLNYMMGDNKSKASLLPICQLSRKQGLYSGAL